VFQFFGTALSPIVNALHGLLNFFYGYTHDLALAIVLMTLVVKLVLHPLTRVQLRSMKAMQVLGPHIKALQQKHKDDRAGLQTATMALYRAHNVNPFGGCLPILVQMPILFALTRLLFYTKDLFANATLFGLSSLRLDEVPSRMLGQFTTHPLLLVVLIFPLLVAGTTWYQQRLTVTDPSQAQMLILMPIMIGYFAMLYPLGLSIYWVVNTLAYIGEYYLVVGRPNPMASAPPKSQTQAVGVALPGQPASVPQLPKGPAGSSSKPGGGVRPQSGPRRKKGARRS
jgi:YidC/Oxa1 family membrane protein insertase